MRILKLSAALFSAVVLSSCNGLAGKQSPADAPGKQAVNAASPAGNAGAGGSADPGSSPGQGAAAQGGDVSQLMDTTKLKAEINSLMNSVASGKPDTGDLKKTASDVLNTTADVLSDSGISKMYGNSNDPAVKSAKEALIRMRNGMGISPDKLDNIGKSAAQLQKN